MLTLQGTGVSSMACALAVVVVVLRQKQSSLFVAPRTYEATTGIRSLKGAMHNGLDNSPPCIQSWIQFEKSVLNTNLLRFWYP